MEREFHKTAPAAPTISVSKIAGSTVSLTVGLGGYSTGQLTIWISNPTPGVGLSQTAPALALMGGTYTTSITVTASLASWQMGMCFATVYGDDGTDTPQSQTVKFAFRDTQKHTGEK